MTGAKSRVASSGGEATKHGRGRIRQFGAPKVRPTKLSPGTGRSRRHWSPAGAIAATFGRADRLAVETLLRARMELG